METLDEFDNEYPLIISFCERITSQDFEEQSLHYTQKALQDLYAQMEQNPSICERVVRKRKQEENEKAGLVRYLKAKFFTMLQGDANCANALGEMEVEEGMEKLKHEMKKANSYARAARRASWRPPERRTRRAFMLGGFSPRQNRWRAPHPVPEAPRIFSSYPKQVERSISPNMDLKQLWAGVTPANDKSVVDLRPLVLNPARFEPRSLGNNPVSPMRSSNLPRFPPSSRASSSHSTNSSSTASAFDTPMQARFKDIKDDENDENDKESPGPDLNPSGT